MLIKKNFLALTGLFICLFLTAHLAANFLLLLPEEHARILYNNYSSALRANPFITIVAYINYACILFHIYYALVITRKNRMTRNVRYTVSLNNETSTWTSQNMLFLGALIFCFITIHMANFWFKVKFQHQDEDLYQMVINLFKDPLYLFIYVLSAIPLALHLSHGVKSAFKTLGLYHKKYVSWVAVFSFYYSLVVGIGFAIIPIVLFFR